MTDRIYDGALDLIGHTPLVRLARITEGNGAELCGKLESSNVAGSVKDRPALSMVLAAEQSGALREGSTVVEATSGNTGISLAMICAVRGYRCVIVMPEDMSMARRHLLKSYGAEVVLTASEDGMAGAVEQAERLLQTTPGSMMCAQFENPANPDIHAKTTAEEIWEATAGQVDAFVAGVGTGGTLTGVGRVLKQRNPDLRLIAVEPRASAVLSGGKPGLHGIQGLGACARHRSDRRGDHRHRPRRRAHDEASCARRGLAAGPVGGCKRPCGARGVAPHEDGPASRHHPL